VLCVGFQRNVKKAIGRKAPIPSGMGFFAPQTRRIRQKCGGILNPLPAGAGFFMFEKLKIKKET
jgi:hypothetical protein